MTFIPGFGADIENAVLHSPKVLAEIGPPGPGSCPFRKEQMIRALCKPCEPYVRLYFICIAFCPVSIPIALFFLLQW